MTQKPTPASATLQLDRAEQRARWFESASPSSSGPLQAASADAGFRSYWRGQTEEGSVIVMDSPPGLEDLRPWLALRNLLAKGGVRVPALLACDEALGFALLEDLGAQTCLQHLAATEADNDQGEAADTRRQEIFEAAIEQLLRLQTIPVPADLPTYDRALLQRELDLFPDWFLHRHLSLQLGDEARANWHRLGERLIERAVAQPRVLVHRDFMLRNLMPLPDGLAVLDFQDAVHGPIAYDPICLLRDAFVSWPPDQVEHWLQHYHRRAREAGLPVPPWPDFRADADWIGAQRHLKVLGIFARLHHRDGKPRYLKDAERFLGYLDQAASVHPELDFLNALIDRDIRPALARQQAVADGKPAAVEASA